MGDHRSADTEERELQAEQAGATEAPAGSAEDAHAAEEAAAEAVEHDLEALKAKAAERDEYLALAQRTQADFENYRKRAARDVQAAQERGAAKVVKELLPALDNLERAIAAAEEQEGEGDHHLTAGIRLVHRELVDALARVGIETISPKGETFDPNVHEAMVSQPVEGAESGTIVEVYQQGYQLNGMVIRPARVVVAA
jgi:molecular chaperone GrpE